MHALMQMNTVVSCDWTATYLCVQAPNVPQVSICIHNEGYDPDLFIIASSITYGLKENQHLQIELEITTHDETKLFYL